MGESEKKIERGAGAAASTAREASPASWISERQDHESGDIYWAIHDALTYEFIANVYSNQEHARLIASALDLNAEVGRLREQDHQWRNWGVIEVMIRNPNVDSFVKESEATAERLREVNTVLLEALKAAAKHMEELIAMAEIAFDEQALLDARLALDEIRTATGRFTTRG